MRKRKKGRKLSRERNQRRALLKSLASALLLNEKIKTNEAKAKEVSSLVEKFITQAKKGDLTSRRLLAKSLGGGRVASKKIVKKLVEEIGPRYKERKGGYTRIIKLGPRKSNGAKMAIIELVK
ncbi:MAG: 50S ribosomal protein L17 [Candidatus Nealsonbacteria bacterium]|nr:MAG: 50S ribosomal protein L17 [Candidatus Nealsonbacteria bacterium]